jgi:hypothetical protein
MPHFEKPTFVTEAGTKAIVSANPELGLEVQTRTALGSESVSRIPADVALVVLEHAEQLRAALTKK